MDGIDSLTSSPPDRSAVPSSLLAYDHWISWREVERDGKTTKLPIDPETGEFASTTDPETWASFETAREQVQFGSEAGVGFVFAEADPFGGVDLDDCRDPETGDVEAWASDVIETLDSFTEISPSGTGFHVLVEGSLPGDRNRRDDLECYETARFFTVTAAHVAGTPSEIHARDDELDAVYDEYIASDEAASSGTDGAVTAGASASLDDESLLQRARAAANGEKFERLWRGDTSGYESHSEADMALCSLLAFWTGGDAQQMDRLFRGSGLLRGKWDEQHYADGSTYGEKTIERAIAGTSEFYEPSGGTTPGADVASSSAVVSSHDPAPARMVSIKELEAELEQLVEANADLEAELVAERERRRELEAQLESDDEGFLARILGVFSSSNRESSGDG